jgi:hypothetical protein
MLTVLNVPEFVLTRSLVQIRIDGRPPSRALAAFQELLIEHSEESSLPPGF